MPRVVVASYNVHGGVDGWGRPFDVVEACRVVGADVVVLQESWRADGEASVAERVACALGYVATELTFSRGRIIAPPVDGATGWGPPLWSRQHHGMRLDRRRPARSGASRSHAQVRLGVRGTWGIAVLTRPAVTATRTIDLGQLPTDPARRGAVVVDLALEDDGRAASLTVVGTHMAHLTQGSPRHVAQLRRAIKDLVPGSAVLAGDMNLWGPPLSAALPGWSRAVRGRSWPTWSSQPFAQTDHLLVTRAVRVVHGEVVRVSGSDHFPVRATIDIT
jgi:endonuclease/exonuclease/phosphatase family metal-dependent hydrolase